MSSPVLSVNNEDANSEDGSTLLSPALASPAAPIFRCRFRTPLFGCVALDAVQREVRGRRELSERGALQAQGERGRKQQERKQMAAQNKRKPAQEGGRGVMKDQQREGAEAAAERAEAARVSHDLAMFVGGPIWAVDWCPLPRYSHTQYLAVACHPHLRPFSPLGVPLSGPALVQVWAQLSLLLSLCPSPASRFPTASYHVPLPQQDNTRWQSSAQQQQNELSPSLLHPAPHGPLLALPPIFQWKSNPAHGPARLPCELAWKVDSASHASSTSPATPCFPHRSADLLAAGFQDGSVRNDPSRHLDVFQPAYETPTISRHGVLQLHFCIPLRALVMAMEDGSLRVLAMRSSLSHHPALPFPLNQQQQQQQQQGKQEHKEEKNRYNRRWVVSTLSLSTAAIPPLYFLPLLPPSTSSLYFLPLLPPTTFSICSSWQLSNNFLINRHRRSKQAVMTVGGFNQLLLPPTQFSTEAATADTSADESFEHRFVFFRGGSSEEMDGEAGQKGKGKLKKGQRDGGEEAEVEEEGGHTADYGGGVVCGNALGCKAVAMHRVAWNANRGFQQWLASGGANGVLRCQLFRLPSDG
ncbi:unnamed protein product [Closterium sp. Naga37s-1]|nr:unnamed protein product [Closterium sp. Naga37s-1]